MVTKPSIPPLDASHPMSIAIDNVQHMLEDLEEQLERFNAPKSVKRTHASMMKKTKLISDWAESTKRLRE